MSTSKRAEPEPTPKLSSDSEAVCDRVVELLPWLLNGSLEKAEQRTVREHLALCEACRGELHELGEVWSLASQHVPSLELARYALGERPVGIERQAVERHLEICLSCRQEADLVRSAEADAAGRGVAGRDADVLDFPPPVISPAGPRRITAAARRFAVAAGVASVVGASSLLWLGEAGPRSGEPAAVPAHEASNAVVAAAEEAEAATGVLFADGFESTELETWSAVVGLEGGDGAGGGSV